MKFLLSIMLLFVCKCAFAGGFYSDYYTPQFYGVSPRGQCLVNGNLCLSNNPISLSRNSVYVINRPITDNIGVVYIPEATIYYHQKINDNFTYIVPLNNNCLMGEFYGH